MPIPTKMELLYFWLNWSYVKEKNEIFFYYTVEKYQDYTVWGKMTQNPF